MEDMTKEMKFAKVRSYFSEGGCTLVEMKNGRKTIIYDRGGDLLLELREEEDLIILHQELLAEVFFELVQITKDFRR